MFKHGTNMVVLFSLIATLGGCGSFVMSRLGAYQNLPLKPAKFQSRLPKYGVVIFKPNPLLLEGEGSEEISAWWLLERRQEGNIKKHVAVLVKPLGGKLFLLAVLPDYQPADYTQSRFALISHDARFCYNAQGQEFFCPDPKEFDWQKQGTVFGSGKQKIGVRVVQRGDKLDRQITAFYRAALRREMTRLHGTSLDKVGYADLAKQESLLWPFLKRAIAAGTIFGVTFASTGSWEAALVSTSLNESLRLLGWLMSPRVFRGPEYFSSPTTRRDLAKRVLGLRAKITQVKTRAQTERATLAKRLQKLEQQLQTLSRQRRSSLFPIKWK